MGSGIEYMDRSKEDILPRTIMHLFQCCRNYECKAKSKEISLPKCVLSRQFIEVNVKRIDLEFSIVNFLFE